MSANHSADVRRIIRVLDSQRKEIDRLSPHIRGEMKITSLEEAKRRIQETVRQLLTAA